MKTQYRDPLGILNSLQHVAEHPVLFNCLLEAAESFDVCMIRRNQFITITQKEKLLKKALEPLSLLHLSRLTVRRHLGSMMADYAKGLEIPLTLQNYLTYSTI